MDVSKDCPRVIDLAASPSDALVVTASATKFYDSLEAGKGNLTTWSLQNGKRIQEFSIESAKTQINCVVFNHNGKMLMTGGADGMIRLFDMHTYSPIMGWPAHDGQVSCVRFNTDETTVASCGLDGQIIEWSLHRVGKKIHTIPMVNQEGFTKWPVTRCEVALESQNSLFLTTCAPPDQVAFVYEATLPTPVQLIEGHTGVVTTLDWHLSLQLCATGSADNTTRVWQLKERNVPSANEV